MVTRCVMWGQDPPKQMCLITQNGQIAYGLIVVNSAKTGVVLTIALFRHVLTTAPCASLPARISAKSEFSLESLRVRIFAFRTI